MLKIKEIPEGYYISLTRGDTLTMTVDVLKKVPPVPPATEPTWEPYELQEGDVVTFAVSKGFKNDAGYERKITKEIPHDTLAFTCSPQETSLDYYRYNFDVELKYANGDTDTFIKGLLEITGEA